ncbi:autotransporter assembly complex family protein [Acidithiobacillus sp.]|jgi:translocation and assembly module TamA|uniref:autotransporter assembly complex protein TamA n=2 Tax=Acidithiobacillus sp. TaxID=1872118 RepID=UPI0025C4163A|nr:BamA/TamA family outer membrane protein [Acidithiobacillus sp.]MCK9358738.1 BamA/TamA family outer membrane protein [Acidithiobacillus sp.]
MRRGLLLAGFCASFLSCGAADADDVHFLVDGVSGPLAGKLAHALPSVVIGSLADRLEETEMSASLRLKDALEAYGYYSARWTEHSEKSAPGKYLIIFSITLGRPILVRRIDLKSAGAGHELTALQRLFTQFPLHKKDILDQIAYEEWKGKVLSFLHTRGYARADYSRHEIRMDRDQFWADIYLWLNTGPRFRFGDITITGAEHYPRWFIQRYLSFKTGDWYSPNSLAVTQSNLRNADRFSDISVNSDLDKAKNDAIPITVDLKSITEQHLKIGAGYSTNIGPNAAIIYDNYNVFDQAQHVRVSILAAQLNRNASVTYSWPVGARLGSEYIAQASYQNQNLTAYNSNEILASAGRQWSLRNENSLSKSATIEALVNSEQANYNVAGQFNNSFYIYPSIQYSMQNFRDILRPIAGYTLTARVEGASKVWGSDANFIRISAQGEWHKRLSQNWVVGTRAKLGAMWLTGPISALPPNLRFFAGGQNSLPGYAYQSQGPLAVDGAVEGGRLLAVGGLDIQRFVTKDWAVVAFYDVGNAFNSWSSFHALQDVGLGMRWYSPVGPIRFDLAHPLVAPQTPAVRIAFSVGFSL